MAVTTRPKQLPRSALIERLREWIDELDTPSEWATLIERLPEIGCPGMAEQDIAIALRAIGEALMLYPTVANSVMIQSYRDHVNYRRSLDEYLGVAATRASHIRRQPDPNINAARLLELEVQKNERRAMADGADEAWAAIQERRVPFDKAKALYAEAFIDIQDWEPTPRK